MDLKPGSRWRSAVCDTEVVVVRAPAAPATLSIGGAGVLPAGAGRPASAEPHEPFARGTILGKRYADEATGLEVLCTKAGTGTITVDGRQATVMTPRRLPASD
ncbi:MAG TPA: hypothetical protein VKG80_07345 [Trebonia sp.]|nr:hypothetical protein [Trebonia sp.]